MTNITKILLKNGIFEMMNENDEYFKKNIHHSLTLKMNDFLTATKKEIQENMLFDETTTKESPQIKYFQSFVEAFEPGNFNFQDGTIINITKEDMKDIVGLFEQLNPEKRQLLASDLFESGEKFQNNLNFAKKVKEIANEK